MDNQVAAGTAMKHNALLVQTTARVWAAPFMRTERVVWMDNTLAGLGRESNWDPQNGGKASPGVPLHRSGVKNAADRLRRCPKDA